MEEDKKEQNTENTKTQKQENTETKENENTENFKKERIADEKQEEEKTTQSADKKKDDGIKSGKIYPDVIPGANVKIYQKIKETKGKEEKERIQVFEGIVLARKGGNSAGATITVQKICKGGFEVKKIYPIHLPAIAKIEILRQAKVRKAKLNFLKKTYKKKLKYENA